MILIFLHFGTLSSFLSPSCCAENFMLEKTPAFAVDYVKTIPKADPIVINSVEYGDENYESRVASDSSQVDGETAKVLYK